MNAHPRITVLMSVYNDELYLGEAIESILNQTFEDFEFFIINDGSTDLSGHIIRSYRDKRIKYKDNQENLGLAKSLNRGIKLAKGKYIARQDSNDISHSDRLRRQYDYMEKTATDVLGCRYIFIDIYGKQIPWLKIPMVRETNYYSNLLDGKSIFPHGLVMLQSKSLKDIGGYNDSFYFAQDCELWLRFLTAKRTIKILDYIGYYYRLPLSSSKEKKYGQKAYVSLLRGYYLNNKKLSDSSLRKVKERIDTLSIRKRYRFKPIEILIYKCLLFITGIKKMMKY